MNPNTILRRTKAKGSALLVAVIFLLLAGLMSLLALNVGVFETRSTSNDIRAKLVNEAAEAGLSQAFEYLLRQQPAMMSAENAALWEPCGATDTTYPCGAISTDAYDHDADPATAAVTRRETMYRLAASGHTDTNFASQMVEAMLNLPNPITKMGPGAATGGGFDVAYGVAPVVCFVAARKVGEASTGPIRCTTPDEATNRRIVTFVSVATMPGEAARTTLTQTVGRFALVDDPLGKPPVVASGAVDVTGGLQIVTNPNAGGPGVPVSVWTRKDVTKSGTPNTCYADEFFRFGAQNSAPPTFFGTTNKTIVCDTCSCNGDKSLSYDKSGNIQAEGIDILDVDGNTTVPLTNGVNYDVNTTYPTCEFPPDLFGHVFGKEAWIDDDHDCFAERKVMEDYTNPNTGSVVNMGADEAFLYSFAESIVNPTTEGASIVSPDQAWAGGYPSASLGGMVWCQSNCNIGPGEVVGSPDKPVILVIDGGGDEPGSAVRIQGRVFGLVFVRTVAGGATLTPQIPSPYVLSSAQIATGGTAVLDMNAGAAIYGALVVQGKIDKANGSASVIHDATVLGAIGDNPNNPRFATLPGAWTDSRSY